MTESKSEVSFSVALLMLAAFLIAWVAILNKELGQQGLRLFNIAYRENQFFFWVLLPMASLNGLWLAAILARGIGLIGQGSRLRALNGAFSKESVWSSFSVLGLGIGTAFGMAALLYFPSLRPPKELARYWQAWIVSTAQPGLFLMLILGRATNLISYLKVRGHILRVLPKLLVQENSLILGSAHEGDEQRDPEWVAVERGALNGAILVTGSIGCGKTQGTVLPYFRQLLTNFSPSPSVMAIDPKRTFIEAAKRICKEIGAEKRVRVISLESKETFNPDFV